MNVTRYYRSSDDTSTMSKSFPHEEKSTFREWNRSIEKDLTETKFSNQAACGDDSYSSTKCTRRYKKDFIILFVFHFTSEQFLKPETSEFASLASIFQTINNRTNRSRRL